MPESIHAILDLVSLTLQGISLLCLHADHFPASGSHAFLRASPSVLLAGKLTKGCHCHSKASQGAAHEDRPTTSAVNSLSIQTLIGDNGVLLAAQRLLVALLRGWVFAVDGEYDAGTSEHQRPNPASAASHTGWRWTVATWRTMRVSGARCGYLAHDAGFGRNSAHSSGVGPTLAILHGGELVDDDSELD
ncbi:hypothetical protein BDZ97DRAFT_2074562 [Flammula alnicola]|nr:hypothetical protein BDZ97DRAFT_2074562 [Flammula alnicola]